MIPVFKDISLTQKQLSPEMRLDDRGCPMWIREARDPQANANHDRRLPWEAGKLPSLPNQAGYQSSYPETLGSANENCFFFGLPILVTNPLLPHLVPSKVQWPVLRHPRKCHGTSPTVNIHMKRTPNRNDI